MFPVSEGVSVLPYTPVGMTRALLGGSGGLGHAAGVATGVVRSRFDRRGRERLGCVGEQLGRIVRHRFVRVDLRTRPRQWCIHAMSEPVRRPDRRAVRGHGTRRASVLDDSEPAGTAPVTG